MDYHHVFDNGRIRVEHSRTATEQLVEKLSNWQRKRWARAGRPRDPEALRRFGRLQRDGTELHSGEVLAP